MTRAKEKEKVDEPQFDGRLDCNGVFLLDQIIDDPRKGCVRLIVYYFDDEEYTYGMEAMGASTPEAARLKISGPKPLAEAQRAFLQNVHLDTRRQH